MKKIISAILILAILCLSAAAPAEEPVEWTCPKCGREGNTGYYCPRCAEPGKITCPGCGAVYLWDVDYMFCPECASRLRPISAGDVIIFGSYEQDNNLLNGPEAIKWTVLDVQDGKALLISCYILDRQDYDSGLTNVTWEHCAMRSWLNNDFLNTAFNETEQSAILLTKVDNSKAQAPKDNMPDGGNNTEDKIFLLSYAEYVHYLTYDFLRDDEQIKARVAPTKYAQEERMAGTEKKSKTAEGMDAGWWWLRTPLYGSETDAVDSAAIVMPDGSVGGYPVVSGGFISIRPALWINLENIP